MARARSLFDWSVEVFPEAFRRANELIWRRELLAYEKEMSSNEASPESLRYWPGYLRKKNFDFAKTAGLEWAKRQAAESPQDDHQASGEIAILNPTLEVVEDQAFWRIDGVVKHRQLSWQDGATIDELRENPRLHFQILERELLQKRFPFKEARAFNEVISDLIRDGLILRRPV